MKEKNRSYTDAYMRMHVWDTHTHTHKTLTTHNTNTHSTHTQHTHSPYYDRNLPKLCSFWIKGQVTNSQKYRIL